MSLRLKFVIVIVLGVVLTALMLGTVVRHTAASAEDAALRGHAEEKLEQAHEIYTETGRLMLESRINDANVPEQARESAKKGRTVTVRGNKPGSDEPMVWAAMPVTIAGEPAVFSVSHSAVEYEEMLSQIDAGILYGSILGAVVIGGIGSIVVGTISKRLVKGAEVARSIADGDMSKKIGDVITTGHDEVSDFADAVDSAVEKLSDRIDTEQRFTADLAHELRTPLTGLINAASLLEEDSRPAELVRERSHRMQELVEDLLEVSRLEGGSVNVDIQPMHVGAAMHALISNMRSAGTIGDHDISTDFALADVVIYTDPRRFERIISNLIVNSIKHGGDPITVTATDRAVRVEDSGPGYPSDILTIGPTRFSSGGGGMGLGLVIAEGQAKLLGMEILFGTGSAGGARTDVKWDPEAFTPPE